MVQLSPDSAGGRTLKNPEIVRSVCKPASGLPVSGIERCLPVKREIIGEGFDMLIMRELTGGPVRLESAAL